MKPTKGERDRSYHVLMFGLSEENAIMKLPKDVLAQRQKQIWEDCYGDMKPAKEKANAVPDVDSDR